MDRQTCTDRSQNQTGTNRGQWGLSARVNTPTRKCESKPQPFPVPQSRLSGWSLTSQSPMVLPRSDNPPLPPLRFLKSSTPTISAAGNALPFTKHGMKRMLGLGVPMGKQGSSSKLENRAATLHRHSRGLQHTHPHTDLQESGKASSWSFSSFVAHSHATSEKTGSWLPEQEALAGPRFSAKVPGHVRLHPW